MQVTTDDGVTINCEVTGDGPPLVLVHGITESAASWGPLLDRLAADRTVVTVDLRGHGRSGHGDDLSVQRLAADVDAVVRALDLGPVDVIGHSLGGMVAAAHAAIAKPRRVVVVDQPLALAGFQEQLRAAEPMLRADVPAFMTALFGEMAGPLAADERARLDAIRTPVPEVVLGIWTPVLEGDAAELDALVRQIGAAITCPVLALHGIDPGPEYAAWLAEVVPTAELEVWPEQGHYPHLVDPDRFLARIEEFLA